MISFHFTTSLSFQDNIRAKENGVNHLQEPLSESPVILENQFSSIVDYVNTDESATWEASIDGNQRSCDGISLNQDCLFRPELIFE